MDQIGTSEKCEFPAALLRAEKRKMARLADETNDPEQMQRCCQFCMRVDQLRLSHEEITGCGCWYKAYEMSRKDAH